MPYKLSKTIDEAQPLTNLRISQGDLKKCYNVKVLPPNPKMQVDSLKIQDDEMKKYMYNPPENPNFQTLNNFIRQGFQVDVIMKSSTERSERHTPPIGGEKK
jgi:hypothetical protein